MAEVSMDLDIFMQNFGMYYIYVRVFFFLTKKVTLIIGVFPTANFPQEKYFSPSNHFFPKKSIFPTLIQSIVTRFRE